MTAPRDTDRLIEAFLGPGLNELPERTYHEVRDHIEHTRQRVVIGPWKEPNMSNLTRVAIAAVVLVAVGFGASRLLPGTSGVGGPSSSPSPTIGATPSPAAASPSPAAPLTLTVEAPYAARLEFTATTDFQLWGDVGEGGKGWYKISVDPPNGVGVTVWRADNVKADPCGGAYPDPPIGPTVDDLADALVSQLHTVVHEDAPVTLDGYSGRYLDYTADLRDCTAGRLERWISPGAIREALGSEHDRVWILDVDGARVVIDAFDFSGSSPADRALIREIVESVQISPN